MTASRAPRLSVTTIDISTYVIVRGIVHSLPAAAFHILLAVADRERHGYAIMQDVAARTDGKLRLGPGTLYGTIKRLLADGLIEELDDRPGGAGGDVRRRYYRITRLGRRIAIEESTRLTALLRHARAMGLAPKTS
jgi:DNA-binding PadR family transcriptional regulator